ncbi:hypothetical protein [Legionella steelei]|nr:hypothetical protein [Legionella steelei]
MFLVKTGAIKFQTKEDFAINNVRNRVEVANSAMLNFFLGEGAAVKNTIAYSTYHNEKNPDNFPSGLKYYLDENGFVKEELASQYAGQFDTPKGKKTEVYNREKLQESGFAPLRKAFVVCGLMGFHDFLGNYDNFAFINGKLMITDTGVGSGNTGQHNSYVSTGNTNFDNDVLKDLDRLFENDNQLVSSFRGHLTIKDVLDGIDELKTKSKEDLKKILDESFKPIPSPFDKSDPRYDDFMRYNGALQLHKDRLYQAYGQRIDALVAFQKVLNKFYSADPEKYHVPSFQTLQEIDRKLTEQNFSPNMYKIYANANEKIFALNKKGTLAGNEALLHSALKSILDEYAKDDINGEQIETIWEQVLDLEAKINCNRENLKKFDNLVNDLKQSLPKKLQMILNDSERGLKVVDPTARALVELKAQINKIKSDLGQGKCTFEEAKSSLTEAVREVIHVSNEQQEKTTLGKTRKLLGFTIQVKGSELSTSLQKFLESKHFLGKELFDKKQGVDLPTIDSCTKYKSAMDKITHPAHASDGEEEHTSFEKH